MPDVVCKLGNFHLYEVDFASGNNGSCLRCLKGIELLHWFRFGIIFRLRLVFRFGLIF
jgi:hypothetical protein